MYKIDTDYLNLADFLRQHKDLLNIQSEISQIDGAISCANSNKMSVAVCGKSDSYFDYLLKLITNNSIECGDILWSTPFKLVYGQSYSVKYLANDEVKDAGSLFDIPKSSCEFIEMTANISLLRDIDLLFLTLLKGTEKNIFDEYISACDYVVLCPNLSNAIGIEYHALCSLIQNEWQQPERVRAIAIDINNLSLPGTMMRALSGNLGATGVISYKIIDDLKDFEKNQKNINSLLNFERDKRSILVRTYSSIDSACRKAEVCLQKYMSQKENLENEIEDFYDRLNAFRAQAVIHIPSLGMILDESMRSDIFHKTAEYIEFVQGRINEEIFELSKDEMDAYVPVYYSSLISEFVKQLSNTELLPVAQKKFDIIVDEILDCYKQSFATNIPEELFEKTKIAKENFFSFVDRTRVDKIDVGIGLVESTILYFLVYENPILCLFTDEIVLLTNRIKRGLISAYDKYIRSTESYAKEVSNRVNAVLDENLQNIPKQIEDVLFPALERNMRKALENFVDEAAKSMETRLDRRKIELANVQKTIKDIQNIQNNLDGLIIKCN